MKTQAIVLATGYIPDREESDPYDFIISAIICAFVLGASIGQWMEKKRWQQCLKWWRQPPPEEHEPN